MADEVVADRRASMLTRVSDEMVRLYKSLFGRGPTRARADFAGPNTLVCTLEDSLTPAERALVDMGQHVRLRDTRMFFQHALEQDFRDAVEAVTGRRVRAFVSGIDTAQDVSAEIFYLEPENGPRSPEGWSTLALGDVAAQRTRHREALTRARGS